VLDGSCVRSHLRLSHVIAAVAIEGLNTSLEGISLCGGSIVVGSVKVGIRNLLGSLETLIGASLSHGGVAAVKEGTRNRVVRPLRFGGRGLDVLLLPFVVVHFHDDLLRALTHCAETVRSGWFLKHIFVGLLVALVCIAWNLGVSASSLDFIASILKHALQLDLFCLLTMDVVLELLDHAVSVLQRVLESFRFELAMARCSLAGRRWRRVFGGQTTIVMEALVRRSFPWRVVLVASQSVGYSLRKLLVLV
jgi:hypothetical protein